MCPNRTCSNRSKWQLILPESKFVDWQRIRLQESPAEVPSGSMPRTIDVVVRHDGVERAKAGDRCVFTGTVVVIPDVSQIAAPGA